MRLVVVADPSRAGPARLGRGPRRAPPRSRRRRGALGRARRDAIAGHRPFARGGRRVRRDAPSRPPRSSRGHRATAALIDAERDVVPVLSTPRAGTASASSPRCTGAARSTFRATASCAWKIARPVETPEDVVGGARGGATAGGRVRLRRRSAGVRRAVRPARRRAARRRAPRSPRARASTRSSTARRTTRDPAFLARLPHVPAALDAARRTARWAKSPAARALFGLVGRPPSRSPSPRIHNAVFREPRPRRASTFPRSTSMRTRPSALPYDGLQRHDAAARRRWRAAATNSTRSRRARAPSTPSCAAGRAPRAAPTRTPSRSRRSRAAGVGEAGAPALVVGGGGFARAAVVALARERVRGARRGARARARDGGGPRRRVRRRGDRRARATSASSSTRRRSARTARSRPRGSRCSTDWRATRGSSTGRTPRGADPARSRARPAIGRCPPWTAAPCSRSRRRIRPSGSPGAATVIEVASLALARPRNLVLVGPRGAGKTTVGRLVARRLGRPFVDTDDEIGRAAGRPAGRVLAEAGEPAFRALETRVVARALARRGAVIALGGGALESEATLARVRRRRLRRPSRRGRRRGGATRGRRRRGSSAALGRARPGRRGRADRAGAGASICRRDREGGDERA